MNIQERDILITIYNNPYINQRELARRSGYSLGTVNKCVKELLESGYVAKDLTVTPEGEELLDSARPRNAIILAAGFGMRMVPINMSIPKGMLEIKGEALTERIIKQLKEAGIDDITIVVGFMKESFDYLIDEYGVKLVINPDYASKNNLHSLALVAGRISSSYIIPSDVWCESNPFKTAELYSWYMVSDRDDPESRIGVNRKREIVSTKNGKYGNAAIGIAYISEQDAASVRARLKELDVDPANDDEFWEKVIFGDDSIFHANIVSETEVREINTYEELRDLDSDSGHLRSDAIEVIKQRFHVQSEDISNITVLKKGMTNRSFLFSVNGEKYIMRIPGEGTDRLINRANEAKVYEAISKKGFCDDPVYINPENGYKITKYLNNIRVADAFNEDDLIRCMDKLRSLHEMKIKVGHTFDIFGQIEFYEELRGNTPSVYRDYEQTKEHVLALKPFIDSQKKHWILTHIDAVPDNFLFYEKNGREELQLTDWEYSGMQDPHVDLAMFSVYSYYGKEDIDHLIDIYFRGKCKEKTRTKIYCYVAACGLLWSNWSEYKHTLGIEFGEYGMRQYRYAKDYYRLAAGQIGIAGRRKVEK